MTPVSAGNPPCAPTSTSTIPMGGERGVDHLHCSARLLTWPLACPLACPAPPRPTPPCPPCPAPQAVHTAVLNPKCIDLGELYGEHNAATSEWQDGLASCLIRAAVAAGDTSPAMQWVVFDGPVDTIWVENMNTGAPGAAGPGCGVGVGGWGGGHGTHGAARFAAPTHARRVRRATNAADAAFSVKRPKAQLFHKDRPAHTLPI